MGLKLNWKHAAGAAFFLGVGTVGAIMEERNPQANSTVLASGDVSERNANGKYDRTYCAGHFGGAACVEIERDTPLMEIPSFSYPHAFPFERDCRPHYGYQYYNSDPCVLKDGPAGAQ